MLDLLMLAGKFVAVVTVTSAAANQTRRVTTNALGDYSVPFLNPGRYEIRVEHAGLKVAMRKDVGLQVGDVARMDFTLDLGEVSQQVGVSGGAPLLVTETTTLGTAIENKRIVELPLNGRNCLQLVTLSPNLTTEVGSGGAYSLGGVRATTSLSMAGQRLEFNRYTLDGVENTDPNWNS
jgi:Carboxypeptidase regulatory-like domain